LLPLFEELAGLLLDKQPGFNFMPQRIITRASSSICFHRSGVIAFILIAVSAEADEG
jgi:hypothetical protein